MKALIFLVVFLSIGFSATEKFLFKNYRLLRLNPTTPQHIDLLANWEQNPDFDVWNRIKVLNEHVDVLLSPSAYIYYSSQFQSAGLEYSILHENIQEKFDEQESTMLGPKADAVNIVGKFARHSQIVSYIDEVVANNPSIASSYVAGTSYENRQIKALVLKTPTSRRGFFLDCGIHAREWIAITTCIWTIDRLINEYKSNDPKTVSILNYYEIHIIPLLNPDGYEYTWNTYRLWRKNRRPNTGSSCVGTDLNRNFGFQWMTGGSSNQPCSDIYAGPKKDSELETIALEKAILARPGFWDSYISIHTYGHWWFLPWSYSKTLPSDYNELLAKATIGRNAIVAAGGASYAMGSSAALLYINSGPSDDWAKGNASIKYSYTLELSPGETGTDSSYGFALPEDRAPKVGAQVYNGIKEFLNSFLP